MRKYKLAGILMFIHGGLMELGVTLFGIVAFLSGLNLDKGKDFSFKLPFFQENLELMLIMSGIFGITRIIGAYGLLKNKMWGLALSIINCIITMVLMIFMIPAGIADGILACSALILMLTEYFGDRKIYD